MTASAVIFAVLAHIARTAVADRSALALELAGDAHLKTVTSHLQEISALRSEKYLTMAAQVRAHGAYETAASQEGSTLEKNSMLQGISRQRAGTAHQNVQTGLAEAGPPKPKWFPKFREALCSKLSFRPRQRKAKSLPAQRFPVAELSPNAGYQEVNEALGFSGFTEQLVKSACTRKGQFGKVFHVSTFAVKLVSVVVDDEAGEAWVTSDTVPLSEFQNEVQMASKAATAGIGPPIDVAVLVKPATDDNAQREFAADGLGTGFIKMPWMVKTLADEATEQAGSLAGQAGVVKVSNNIIDNGGIKNGLLKQDQLVEILELVAQANDFGLLMDDPHPGNIMKTANGKYVFIDFALATGEPGKGYASDQRPPVTDSATLAKVWALEFLGLKLG